MQFGKRNRHYDTTTPPRPFAGDFCLKSYLRLPGTQQRPPVPFCLIHSSLIPKEFILIIHSRREFILAEGNHPIRKANHPPIQSSRQRCHPNHPSPKGVIPI